VAEAIEHDIITDGTRNNESLRFQFGNIVRYFKDGELHGNKFELLICFARNRHVRAFEDLWMRLDAAKGEPRHMALDFFKLTCIQWRNLTIRPEHWECITHVLEHYRQSSTPEIRSFLVYAAASVQDEAVLNRFNDSSVASIDAIMSGTLFL
jgi:hypothetical protein